MIYPKNWSEFQHYKDRNPPWIKLHRTLLDDPTFQRLPIASRALAPMLWLQASSEVDGQINMTTDEMAFRFRMSHDELLDALNPLVKAGLFIDASGMLAECLQSARPETETETKTEPKKSRTTQRTKKPTGSVPVELLPSLQTLVDEWPRQCLPNNGVTQRLAGFSDPVSLYEQMTKHWPREEPELMVNCGLLYLDSIVYPTDEWTGKRGMPGFVYAMANFYGPKQEYWKRNKGEVIKTMMEANNATA